MPLSQKGSLLVLRVLRGIFSALSGLATDSLDLDDEQRGVQILPELPAVLRWPAMCTVPVGNIGGALFSGVYDM